MTPDFDRHEHEGDGDDIRSAEYVLGTMDADAREAFAARAARDPALARMTDAWRARLSPMAEEFESVSPPMHLWHGIRRRLGLDVAERTSTPLWERLAFWRGMGLAGLATTAACVVALVTVPRIVPSPVPSGAHSALPHPVRLVSTLADGKGRTTFVAAVDDDACTIVLMPRDRQPAPGQVPELWVIGADGVPRSLGVGSDAPLQAMTVPDAMRPGLLRAGLQQTGAILAVSMEAPGGSTTGRPTGFIAGKGPITRL